MISFSQISLSQDSSRQVSAFDASRLRINRQPAALPAPGSADRGYELTLRRDAAYRYQAQEQTQFSTRSRVAGDQGSALVASAVVAERSAELLLMGQQALSVGRAALGSDAGVAAGGSVSVTAGRYLFYSESESRSVSASGSIALESGERIDFTLSLRQSQSRSYQYSELVQIQERPLTDPLVINFGTTSARLTDTLFEFDMTGTGEQGQFATLGAGSGYLVLDRNGNGRVDDGSELFGPRSGSGFAELARYDDDGNRWIDASDEVFGALAVWVQTADGGQALRSLAEVGVKALYVDSVADRFTLTNGQGVPLGQIKATGLYLSVDGEIRTLEELDLAEQTPEAAPAVETPLGRVGPDAGAGGVGLVEARVEAIRSALAKLNEIREKQQAFIEASKDAAEAVSPLDEYLRLIDRLRLELLSQQDEKKQAASRYLEFAAL